MLALSNMYVMQAASDFQLEDGVGAAPYRNVGFGH